MNIQIATHWEELNQWQLGEITHILLKAEKLSDMDFVSIVRVLVMREKGVNGQRRWQKALKEIGLRELLIRIQPLLDNKELYTFPQVSDKLAAPKVRMNNCTIRQFSYCDAIYYRWRKSPNPIYMKQLAACLYTLKKNQDIDSGFDPLLLSEVAQITDTLDEKLYTQMLFAFMCIRHYIEKRYPKLYSQPEKEDTLKPRFTHKTYVPFSKVIYAMALANPQPLGNLQVCQQTRLYDFLDILQVQTEMQG